MRAPPKFEFVKKMDASASSEATICELEAHGSPDPDASAVTECELEDLDTTITELTPECTSTPIARSSKSRIRGMYNFVRGTEQCTVICFTC